MTNTKQLLKAAIIVVLIALLLIPTVFISNLVKERKLRKEAIAKEVAASWATQQTISTPYLQVFYNKKSMSGAASTITSNGYIMSNSNKAIGNLKTEYLKRSIYTIPVYNSAIKMDGVFSNQDIEAFKTTYGEINWTNSFLGINISDTKGIADSAIVTINGKSYNLNVTKISGVGNVKTLAVPMQLVADAGNGDIAYKIEVVIKGTERWSFIPLAANNSIELTSNWKDPSFEGQSTMSKEILASGFTAKWKINGNSLSIPKISENWVGTNGLHFGVNLINVVDSYTKTMRCTKYALLFIGLTFALFYFFEQLKNTQIHPVQYVLVGLALVIFFTLLLSISEYIHFDIAYLIASLATIVLIAFYAKSVMKSSKNGLLIGGVLVCLYGFMYMIIQLEETSLLVGSIGLFITLAIVMQLSKKVKWNALPNLIPNNK